MKIVTGVIKSVKSKFVAKGFAFVVGLDDDEYEVRFRNQAVCYQEKKNAEGLMDRGVVVRLKELELGFGWVFV